MIRDDWNRILKQWLCPLLRWLAFGIIMLLWVRVILFLPTRPSSRYWSAHGNAVVSTVHGPKILVDLETGEKSLWSKEAVIATRPKNVGMAALPSDAKNDESNNRFNQLVAYRNANQQLAWEEFGFPARFVQIIDDHFAIGIAQQALWGVDLREVPDEPRKIFDLPASNSWNVRAVTTDPLRLLIEQSNSSRLQTKVVLLELDTKIRLTNHYSWLSSQSVSTVGNRIYCIDAGGRSITIRSLQNPTQTEAMELSTQLLVILKADQTASMRLDGDTLIANSVVNSIPVSYSFSLPSLESLNAPESSLIAVPMQEHLEHQLFYGRVADAEQIVAVARDSGNVIWRYGVDGGRFRYPRDKRNMIFFSDEAFKTFHILDAETGNSKEVSPFAEFAWILPLAIVLSFFWTVNWLRRGSDRLATVKLVCVVAFLWTGLSYYSWHWSEPRTRWYMAGVLAGLFMTATSKAVFSSESLVGRIGFLLCVAGGLGFLVAATAYLMQPDLELTRVAAVFGWGISVPELASTALAALLPLVLVRSLGGRWFAEELRGERKPLKLIHLALLATGVAIFLAGFGRYFDAFHFRNLTRNSDLIVILAAAAPVLWMLLRSRSLLLYRSGIAIVCMLMSALCLDAAWDFGVHLERPKLSYGKVRFLLLAVLTYAIALLAFRWSAPDKKNRAAGYAARS